jgi:GAF domain-containing protein
MDNLLFLQPTPTRQYASEREYLLEVIIPTITGKRPNHEWLPHLKQDARFLSEAVELAIQNRRLREALGRTEQQIRILSEQERSLREYVQKKEWQQDYEAHEARETANRTLDEKTYRQTKGIPNPQPEGWEPALRPGLNRMQEANR